ncbi:MAG: DegT/DnrJ/EryC1/StrS family aminotransferase [Anaerolineae bacterium]
MMIPFFDLKKQYESIQSEIDAASARVFKSGWFILGPEVEAFEAEFAQYIGVRYAAGVGSGTEALHLALLALGVGPGDEVITVPNTAVATVVAIELTGAKPVLVDVCFDSMNMDMTQVETAITPRTRVIIPVHLFGQAADLDPVFALAQQHHLAVLEDCAQAHGATYRGHRVGSLGDISAFSFYPTKNLGAYGDGGMIVTNNPRLIDQVRLLRQYGWRERYQSETHGMNSRLDELQAALLRVKLKHLDQWNQARRERAALYTEWLDGVKVQRPVEKNYGKPVYHLYVIQSQVRDQLAAFLKEKGIGTAIQYPTPIHQQLAYRHLARRGALTTSERLAAEILSLPLYPELPIEDMRTVVEAIRAFEPA